MLFLIILLVLPCGVFLASSPAHGTDSNSALTRQKQQQEELLRYAKGIFVASLGFGEEVPPAVETYHGQRACFVTFFVGKRVVACFGGFQPRTANVVREIAANVAGALRNDPRARHISREMALTAGVQITFPRELVPISDYRRVDPLREGLFAENDRQGVAIVPGEAKTAAWAYREALRRLGKTDPSELRLYKFAAECITTRSGGNSAL